MRPRTLIGRALLLFLILIAAFPLTGRAQEPPDDTGVVEVKGLVEFRPADTTVGVWQVSGVRFLADAETTFEGFGGTTPGLGACVEVDIAISDRTATLFTPDDDCSGPDDPAELGWRGVILTQPEGAGDGIWRLSGPNSAVQEFLVTSATFFEGFGAARPAPGVCVEVKYVVQAGSNVALRLRPEDCSLDDDEYFFRGPVDSRPADGRIGRWEIGGGFFVTTAETEFEGFAADQPVVGDCVALRYDIEANERQVDEMRPAECGGGEPGLFGAYGLVDSLPEGARAGAWVIGGVEYTATAETAFDEYFGAFEVGRCVVLLYRAVEGERVAVKLVTSPIEQCRPSDEVHSFYGLIDRLPDSADQRGPWVIGGREVMVTEDTVLEDGPFSVGTLVEAHVRRAPDGTWLAVRIEARPDDGGEGEPDQGKAYGAIGALPADGPVGEWTIGGVVYSVTAETALRPGPAPFAVDDCVEVYFRAAESGPPVALGIAFAGDDCQDSGGQDVYRAYGSITALPAEGFIGTWSLGGGEFEVNAQTEIEYEAGMGAPVVGSFVRVTYAIADGKRVATSVHVLTPPGMGDEDKIGRLEREDSPRAVTGAWSIDGVRFLITDDTMLNGAAAALDAGTAVKVNLAIDPASGARVATEVTTLANFTRIYLPILLK